ncbi:bifunctional DNA primase/polymerase [Lacticaseibacillus sp. 866-1]|uniref:bifunctional DNA primase/polymerase n=1 Tax=Lacticaseibacillus sp. 866-1 TaxID=2799576 RepID=UPI0019435F7C|nr:bifunctional DNA primase/polymerase [Lacticaseibacillus sp. 866-1]
MKGTFGEFAQKYQQKGFPVYPLAPGTSIPFKGSHGFKDATLDQAQAAEWWQANPLANIGIGLSDISILVFDIDAGGHASGVDGLANLKRLMAEGRAGVLPSTYTEQTPGGGFHYFYHYPADLHLTQRANLFATGEEVTGLDYNAQGVPVLPSIRHGKRYKRAGDKRIADIAEAPRWLLDELERVSASPDGIHSIIKKKWAGKLLDEMVNGAGVGSRNDYLTRLAGKLIFTGADPDTVYNLLLITNDNFLDEPLDGHEVDEIYKSVMKHEEGRQD